MRDRYEACMSNHVFLKPLLFILVVMLCMTSLMVIVHAESWGWSKLASPTGADLQSVGYGQLDKWMGGRV